MGGQYSLQQRHARPLCGAICLKTHFLIMKQAVFTKYRLTIDHQKATFTKLMSIITRGKTVDI